MIAFGCTVGEAEPYVRYAEPGIRRVAEPDSEIFAFASVGTIGRSLNVLLDAAAAHDDLEALVIMHPHTEIVDPDLCEKVRAALVDPDVAIVGCIGASGVRNIAWWEGQVSSGTVVHRYVEHGGGDVRAFPWASAGDAPAEVDAVDGFLLVLSPWAVRNIRFDEALTLTHGFDVDYCLQARAAGRKVMTGDFHVVEHRALIIIVDIELWTEAHVRMAEKWNGRLPGQQLATTDWKRRARRAEAEREAARAIAHSRRLAMDARIAALEEARERTLASASWRFTKPLRRANLWRSVTMARLGRRNPAVHPAALTDPADPGLN